MLTITGSETDIIYIKQESGNNYYQINSLDSGGWTLLSFELAIENNTISPTQNLTVKIITNMTLTSINDFFICNSDNITIDGSDNLITLDNISDYSGLIENSTNNNLIINKI